MRTSFATTLVALALPFAVGCGNSEETGVTIQVKVSVCRAAQCTLLPASTAEVQLLNGDRAVARGEAGSDGVFKAKVAPGTYTVKAELVELEVLGVMESLVVDAGGALELDLVLTPALQAIPQQ